MADMMSIIAANYKTVGTDGPDQDALCGGRSGSLRGQLDRKIRRQKTFKITVSNVTGFRAKVQYQSGGTSKFQEVLIKDNAFRVGDTKFTLTGNNTAVVKNVVTDSASGQTYLDQAYAKRPERRANPPPACSLFLRSPKTRYGSGLAVGRAQALRGVLGQVERVEIGAAAQHGFLGKLLHHLARPVVDDLIDDGAGVAIDHHLVRHRSTASKWRRGRRRNRCWRARPHPAAETLWLAGSSVATACCAASLTC